MTFGDERLPAHFWTKVAVQSSGCWLWTASKSDGYGRFAVNRKLIQRAHRVAYIALVGLIPVDLQIDHLCRNRACVNPDHLEPVSQKTNILRGQSISAERAKQTHCLSGHAFDEENTAYVRQGHYVLRRCRACQRARQKRYRTVARLAG